MKSINNLRNKLGQNHAIILGGIEIYRMIDFSPSNKGHIRRGK